MTLFCFVDFCINQNESDMEPMEQLRLPSSVRVNIKVSCLVCALEIGNAGFDKKHSIGLYNAFKTSETQINLPSKQQLLNVWEKLFIILFADREVD